jgi:hypothetical protein
MDRAQRVKVINILYNLTPDHARKVGDILEAESQQSRSSVDDEVQKIRTMHKIAHGTCHARDQRFGQYSRSFQSAW